MKIFHFLIKSSVFFNWIFLFFIVNGWQVWTFKCVQNVCISNLFILIEKRLNNFSPKSKRKKNQCHKKCILIKKLCKIISVTICFSFIMKNESLFKCKISMWKKLQKTYLWKSGIVELSFSWWWPIVLPQISAQL